ncbi:MAG: hypothetical protein U0794_21845 [Isosphaeraceae bacterium]
MIGVPLVGLLATPAMLFAATTEPMFWIDPQSPGFLPRILAGLLALFGLANGMSMWHATYRGDSIVPYFPSKVGNIDTFGRGHRLARWFEPLEELAATLNVRPLSDFGFADDLAGEKVVWHDPADGLRTVEALRASVADRDTGIPHDPRLLEDLQHLSEALAIARDRKIAFSLLYRAMDGTSAQEWEVRQGTAF